MRKKILIYGFTAILLGGLITSGFAGGSGEEGMKDESERVQRLSEDLTVDLPAEIEMEHLSGYSTALAAGGCFWCMEPPFEEIVGVAEVISGYAGGTKENPTYQEVSAGETDYIESVMIYFNPDVVSYEQILEIFWRNIDPTDDGGQFVDRGHQYTTAVFYQNEDQRKAAEKSKKSLAETGPFTEPLVTDIREAQRFYRAETYHQDYYEKDPKDYKNYRSGSGRDEFIREKWGDPEVPGVTKKAELYGDFDKDNRLDELTELQYEVTQERGTEPAFDNRYWDNKEPGIYVDIVSGEPLFSSREKFESGTGWPSFTTPLEPDNIIYAVDTRLSPNRTEVISRYGRSHLGHVFTDGPEPFGIRYCMNSAALRFIPAEDLEEEGYGQFLVLFQE